MSTRIKSRATAAADFRHSPAKSSGWRAELRHSQLWKSWQKRSSESQMFLGADFMSPVLVSPHICCLVTKSCPTLYATPWTVAHQVPLSMGFPRQEPWSGCYFLPQGVFWPRWATRIAHFRKALKSFMMKLLLVTSRKKYILECMYSPFTKITYILTSPTPPLWRSFSELSELLYLRLWSLFCCK